MEYFFLIAFVSLQSHRWFHWSHFTAGNILRGFDWFIHAAESCLESRLPGFSASMLSEPISAVTDSSKEERAAMWRSWGGTKNGGIDSGTPFQGSGVSEWIYYLLFLELTHISFPCSLLDLMKRKKNYFRLCLQVLRNFRCLLGRFFWLWTGHDLKSWQKVTQMLVVTATTPRSSLGLGFPLKLRNRLRISEDEC